MTTEQQELLSQAQEDIVRAEAYRREHKNMDDYPIHGTLDYASSGQVMEMALAHLRESIPNGQRERTTAAFRALKKAVNLQALWLRAKGLDV